MNTPLDLQPLTDTSHYDKCRTLMHKHKRSHMIRSVALFIFSILNGYGHIITLPIVKGWEFTPETTYSRIGIYTMGFPFALLALLCMVAVFVMGFLFRQDKPKLILIPLGLTILCIFFDLFNILWGIIIAVLLAVGLYESREAVWVRAQEGYPYFNERFAAQEDASKKGYVPRYDLSDTDAQAEMHDLCAGETDSFNTQKNEMPEVFYDWQTTEETPQPAAQTVSLEKPIALPDPVPDVLDLPDPVADFPDPIVNFPDPITDTSVITSDFPEINGDIADLPDIPDIPKI